MTRREPTFLEAPAERYLSGQAVAWEPDAVRRIRDACLEDEGPVISAQAGRTLHTLATAVRARRVLEVGTLYGYSAACLALALPEGGHVDTLELDEAHAAKAEAYLKDAGVGERVRVHRGRALDVLPTLEGPYDVVFLDALKHELPAYLDHALRVTEPGALVLADNVLWHGRVWDEAATDADTEGVRAFTRRINEDARLVTTVLPVGDGLSVSVRVG